MSKGNIVYDSALSVEDNARLNGVSVATIRRYIKINSIDRRSDKKREILAKINNLLRKKPSITPNEICAELGYSLNTIKKYLKFDINSVRTEIGKISAYDLTKKNNVILSVSDNQNEILKSIIKLHNKFLSINDNSGLALSDKQLHFIIIGLFGFGLLLVVQPLFRWISKHYGLLFITFSYVFTIVLVVSFAIEIGQAYTGTGTMDFYDVASGLLGFFVAFAVYLIFYIIFHHFKRPSEVDDQE